MRHIHTVGGVGGEKQNKTKKKIPNISNKNNSGIVDSSLCACVSVSVSFFNDLILDSFTIHTHTHRMHRMHRILNDQKGNDNTTYIYLDSRL